MIIIISYLKLYDYLQEDFSIKQPKKSWHVKNLEVLVA